MDQYRNKKILITGGLGFIGSNLAIRLVELGADVTILDSLDPRCGGNTFNIAPVRDAVRIRIADMQDRQLMRDLVFEKNFIFNLAGQVSHIDSMEDPFQDLAQNCISHLSLLEACRYVNREARIIYTNTRQTYGRASSLPVTEEHLLHPVDVNGVNNMAGEWHHLVYHDVYGIRSVSLRLVNTYGPRQLVRHHRQGFIGWFVKRAIDGEEIQVYGDGMQLRDMSHVDDVVNALLVAGVTDSVFGDVYNLGGPKPVTLEEIARTLIDVAGRGAYRIVPFPPERKSIDIGSFYTDFSKFTSATKWKPLVSLKDGLARTLDYYRQHRKHYW